MHIGWIAAVGLVGIFGACAASQDGRGADGGGVEATSLLGTPLVRPAVDPARAERLERDLAAAIGRRDSSPDDPDAWVWVGRRLGYLGRFREAVRVYDEAVGRFPKDAALLRHRGHRHLTLRNFPAATADLARAWELAKDAPDVVEPDGAPTPGVPPRSTLKSNILYHLGLSWYFRGNFDEAAEVFGRAVALGVNDDARVAANWWRCLSLARIGDKPGLATALALVSAPDVLGGMDVRENTAYWNLQLVWAGTRTEDSLSPKDGPLGLSVDQATIGYGLAQLRRLRGEHQEATQRAWAVIRNTSWASFGHIAAEADIFRDQCDTLETRPIPR